MTDFTKDGTPSVDERPAANRVSSAFERLRELIVRGRLAPGTRLVEADLAERLHVSRTPVRSALLKLQHEGYVVEAGGDRQSRLSVAPLTSEDARELWWIVGALEGVAARWAAHLDPEDRDGLVSALSRINDDLRRVAEADYRDPNRIFELDSAFHRRFVEVSAGPRLLALHHSIKPQTERYWRIYTSSIVDELQVSTSEHDRIIRAIGEGDAAAAQDAVEFNWHRGGERLARAIEALGARGSW